MYKLFLLLFSVASIITHPSYGKINASNDGSNAIVYVAGDIADCRSKESKTFLTATTKLVSSEIEQNPTASILTLGDHTYPVGLPAEFETCYEPAWGKFKNRTFPTPGNHEYQTPNAYGYFQYFGDAAGSQQHSYYSFNKGSWHIISLNSNLKDEQRQAQLNWLAEDLKKNRSSCTLAFWHHPVYSSGLHGSSSRMQSAWKMLMDAKADVVLSGHDHHYERFALQNAQGKSDEQTGIREFIVGTGGVKLMPVLWKKANSEVINKHAHGVLKLTLKKQSYTWQFLPVNGATFTDEGSASCHKK